MQGNIHPTEVAWSFYEHEKKKPQIYRSISTMPKVCRLVKTWKKETLSVDELRGLQVHVLPATNPPRGNLSVFRELQTVYAGEIAEQMKFLRRSDNPGVRIFIGEIDSGLHQLVLSNRCPAIMKVDPVCLNSGNIADGNHRVLARLEQWEVDRTSKLPAYVGTLPYPQWLIFNCVGLAYYLKHSPHEAKRLYDKREMSLSYMWYKSQIEQMGE